MEHQLSMRTECKPVQQKLRRVKPVMLLKIKGEVKKQLDAVFLEVEKYSKWVANIVPVPKKDGKVRMCVDYRDLNRASLKDNFPLSHIDTLVDNTAKNSRFSFMDGFSEYNQIWMALKIGRRLFLLPCGKPFATKLCDKSQIYMIFTHTYLVFCTVYHLF